ncbi:glycosyltransferase family 2 protein [Microbacterium sp.]|uniref:glycosyltransferase family 2 protein n=1 Tax=Microbacterium sp. TaxID=51671 RepID=UPI0039E50886
MTPKTADAPLRCLIAIPTYRRNELLDDLLKEVEQQAETMTTTSCVVTVLVVDNDPAEGAAAVVARHRAQYVPEPAPGIAAVRNRALHEAHEHDVLIFIDDDELPAPGWLDALLARYRHVRPAAVAGRVLTPFPEDTEAWIPASGAFVRPTRQDGQILRECATNNLLLDVAAVAESGLRFDERFGLSGGSDSLFSRQLTARGYRIVWAEDSLVVEREDPERFTRDWVLRRTYRFGNTSARVEIALAQGTIGRAAARVRVGIRGLARLTGGSLRAVVGRVTGSLHHRARGERTAARGRGMLAGIFGRVYSEYGLRRGAAG